MKIKRYNEFITESTEYGTRDQVESGLDAMKIENYSINDDLSVDVDGDVDLSDNNLTEIEVKFNYIDGDFLCYTNRLSTLKNTPNKIKGNFSCSYNNLTSLEYCPKFIENELRCIKNRLTSLTGIPIDFDLAYLWCSENNLHKNDLKGNGLESILSTDESLITYHIDWIKNNTKSMTESFKNNFGYLLEFEHYTKTL